MQQHAADRSVAQRRGSEAAESVALADRVRGGRRALLLLLLLGSSQGHHAWGSQKGRAAAETVGEVEVRPAVTWLQSSTEAGPQPWSVCESRPNGRPECAATGELGLHT